MFKLTEKQQEIVESNARIKLVMGANRSGKTITAILNMWNQMENEKNDSFKGIYLVSSMPVMKMIVREIKRHIPMDCFVSITTRENCSIIKTIYGEIFVSTKLINFDFDNKTIDNATSNKYIGSIEFWEESKDCKVYITGHFPNDINNDYFKLWLSGYFFNNPGMKAFILPDTFCNIAEKESTQKLIDSMGENRFNREYLAIPDYFELKQLTYMDK